MVKGGKFSILEECMGIVGRTCEPGSNVVVRENLSRPILSCLPANEIPTKTFFK